jgi:hypothetical protein
VTTVKVLAWIVILVIAAHLAHVALNSGFDHGAGFDTFLAGVGNPWQMMINTDLVAGLLLTIAWLVYRERHAPVMQRIAWAWTAAWWGNIVIAVYVLRLAGVPGQSARGLLLGGTDAVPLPPGRVLRAAALVLALLLAAWLAWELMRPGIALIAIVGYLAGFTPLILSLLLIGRGSSARPVRAS